MLLSTQRLAFPGSSSLGVLSRLVQQPVLIQELERYVLHDLIYQLEPDLMGYLGYELEPNA